MREIFCDAGRRMIKLGALRPKFCQTTTAQRRSATVKCRINATPNTVMVVIDPQSRVTA